VLPAPIERVALRGPKQLKAGQAFAWSAEVQDGEGKAIRASVPLRLRLLDAGGRVLEEQFTAVGAKRTGGTMRSVRNAAPGAQTLEVTELFSGQTARLAITVEAPPRPASLAAADDQADAAADATARGSGADKGLTPPEGLF